MKTPDTKNSGLLRRDVLKLGASLTVAGAASLVRIDTSSSQDITKVNVLSSSPAILPLWSIRYLAEDLGYYKAEGLEVENRGLNGGPAALTALLAGAGDVNVSSPGELLAANAKGQRVLAIECQTSIAPLQLCVSKDLAAKYGITAKSGVGDREAALKAAIGSRFGVNAPGSQTDMYTRIAMKQVGRTPQDYEIKPLGNELNTFAAFNNKAIDGAMLNTPFAEQAIVEGLAIPLLSVTKGEIPAAMRMVGQVVEAKAEDVEKRPDVFERLVRAHLKAMRYIHEQPGNASEVLHKRRFPKLNDEIWTLVWQNNRPTFATPYVKPDSLRGWIETGLIGGNPDPDTFPYASVIDHRFVDAGLKTLGWSVPT